MSKTFTIQRRQKKNEDCKRAKSDSGEVAKIVHDGQENAAIRGNAQNAAHGALRGAFLLFDLIAKQNFDNAIFHPKRSKKCR
jgi:hypothetical protein